MRSKLFAPRLILADLKKIKRGKEEAPETPGAPTEKAVPKNAGPKAKAKGKSKAKNRKPE